MVATQICIDQGSPAIIQVSQLKQVTRDCSEQNFFTFPIGKSQKKTVIYIFFWSFFLFLQVQHFPLDKSSQQQIPI